MDTKRIRFYGMMDTTGYNKDGKTMVSKSEKLKLLKQIKQLKEKGYSFREISKEMGRKEAWGGVFWRRNEKLHHLLDTKVDTKPTQVDTKPVPAAPSPLVEIDSQKKQPPKVQTKEITALKTQMEMLLSAFLIPPEQRKLVDLFSRMNTRARDKALALGVMLDAMETNREHETLKFKPRDLRDVEEKLGSETFQWVWQFLMATNIVIPEYKLPEPLAQKLGVTKTTGGRYVYNYFALEEQK